MDQLVHSWAFFPRMSKEMSPFGQHFQTPSGVVVGGQLLHAPESPFRVFQIPLPHAIS